MAAVSYYPYQYAPTGSKIGGGYSHIDVLYSPGELYSALLTMYISSMLLLLKLFHQTTLY